MSTTTTTAIIPHPAGNAAGSSNLPPPRFTADSIAAAVQSDISRSLFRDQADDQAFRHGWLQSEMADAMNCLAILTESADGDERTLALKDAAKIIHRYRLP